MAASLAIHPTAAHSRIVFVNDSDRFWVVPSRASVLTTALDARSRSSAVTTAATDDGFALRMATTATDCPSTRGRPCKKTPTLSARPGCPAGIWSLPIAT
jgi:hypothetical protein